MRFTTVLACATALAVSWSGAALADGKLNIFNWGNYTNPELIDKFEKKYNVDVSVTDYDSNDTALAKVRAGGHGFDIVVPSATYMPIWIKEGLLLETRPDKMENFKNVEDKWVNVDWDPGRHYSVPWQWGTVGVVVDTFHVWWDPQLAEQVRRAAHRIAAYQVCDWITPLPPDALLARGMMGDGHIDFRAVTRLVAEAGYAGDVEVEIFNQAIWDADPLEVALRTVKSFEARVGA